jgi:hypothetical protein
MKLIYMYLLVNEFQPLIPFKRASDYIDGIRRFEQFDMEYWR